MDFSGLKKYTDQLNPLISKAKELGDKALEFTETQAQGTPLYIKTQEEYDALHGEKRLIMIAYSEEDEQVAHEIILLTPVWATKAFMDNASIRLIVREQAHDLIQNLGYNPPLEMRVRYQDVETVRLQDLTSIKKWWETRNYAADAPSSVPTPDTPSTPTPPTDPLA